MGTILRITNNTPYRSQTGQENNSILVDAVIPYFKKLYYVKNKP